MGYVLIGRPAIFAFNGVIILLCLGAMIIYFNLFGQVSSDIVRTMSHKDIDNDSFYLDTKFYVLLAAVGLLYPAIKRSVEELKIVSIGLFTCIVFITFTTIIMLGEDGTSNNPDEDLAEYWYLNFDRSTVTTLAAFIFSYSCQVNIF
jgi:amino acid permease